MIVQEITETKIEQVPYDSEIHLSQDEELWIMDRGLWVIVPSVKVVKVVKKKK